MECRRATLTTASALLLAGCSYGVETLPKCFSENVPPSLRAVAQLARSNQYKGGVVDLTHMLCSTYDDRLGTAEKLLTAAGFPHETGIAELGKCIDVDVKTRLTSQVLDQQVTTFCGIAAAARVAYVSWSGRVGEKFVYVSGKYISITGRGELPKPL